MNYNPPTLQPSNPHSIVFFGTGAVSLKTLEGIKPRFRIEAVITKPDAEVHGKKIEHPVKVWAQDHRVPVFQPADKEQLSELFQKHEFQSQVGLIVDYGLIVPKDVLDYFPYGIVNSHFSLLPQWRGADPITAAILSGQPKTGVSLMITAEKLDTGKLLAYKSLETPPNATTPSLTEQLIELSNSLIIEYLPRYLKGEVKPRAQPHPDRATHAGKITKADGRIDWTKPAERLEREVRAYLGWPGSYTRFGDKQIIITKSEIGNRKSEIGKKPGEWFVTEDKKLAVQTGRDILVVERIKPAGRREISGVEFIRGYLS